MKFAQLLDHEGWLAQFRGDRTREHEPVIERRLAVSTIPIGDWPGVEGAVPWSPFPSWDGEVRTAAGSRVMVRANDWTEQTVLVRVPKPRDGKRYTWQWQSHADHGSPGWAKDWFPLCSDCNDQHAPGRCRYA